MGALECERVCDDCVLVFIGSLARESCLQFILICYLSRSGVSGSSAVSLHTNHLIYLFVIKSIFLHYSFGRSGYCAAVHGGTMYIAQCSYIHTKHSQSPSLSSLSSLSLLPCISAFLFRFATTTYSFRFCFIFTSSFGASIFLMLLLSSLPPPLPLLCIALVFAVFIIT